MTRPMLLAVLTSLFLMYCVHKFIAEPLVKEPTPKGIFALEVAAVTLIFAALVSDEIWKRSKGEATGVSAKQIALVFITVLASGCVYVAIAVLAERFLHVR